MNRRILVLTSSSPSSCLRHWLASLAVPFPEAARPSLRPSGRSCRTCPPAPWPSRPSSPAPSKKAGMDGTQGDRTRADGVSGWTVSAALAGGAVTTALLNRAPTLSSALLAQLAPFFSSDLSSLLCLLQLGLHVLLAERASLLLQRRCVLLESLGNGRLGAAGLVLAHVHLHLQL